MCGEEDPLAISQFVTSSRNFGPNIGTGVMTLAGNVLEDIFFKYNYLINSYRSWPLSCV